MPTQGYQISLLNNPVSMNFQLRYAVRNLNNNKLI